MTTHQDEAADFVFLSEALDALDRLYDGRSRAVDVAAILTVVGAAITNRSLGEQLLFASERVRQAIRNASPAELSAAAALVFTEVVRGPIAEVWAELSLRHEHR